MAISENNRQSEISDIARTARIAVHSISPRFPNEVQGNREAFRSVVGDTLKLPTNIEEGVSVGINEIVEGRGLSGLSIDYSKTYWEPGQAINHWDVLNALGQYVDFHRYELPKTALPPEKDVKAYIDRVKESDHPLTIPDQLEILLDISENNIVGAANIGFMGSRHAARSYEKRAYPNIPVTPQDHIEWNQKVAQFEVYDESGRMDGPGDNYYFWSHFYGALAYEALGDRKAKYLQKFLGIGTPLMRTVRTHIAHRPTETLHEEASVLGRNLGLSIAEAVGVKERPIYNLASPAEAVLVTT